MLQNYSPLLNNNQTFNYHFNISSHWWLVELPMSLTDGFSVTFLEGEGDCVHTHELCTATVHGN